MKNSKAIMLAILLLLTLLFVWSDCSDAASSKGVVISEVSPADEAVTLENRGTSTIDLRGYEITDGEGTLVFSSSFKLQPGSSVTLSKTTGTDWFNSRGNVLTFTSTPIIKSGSFVLANSGDEVVIRYNGAVVDSICYGTSGGAAGWLGEPVTVCSGQYLLRISTADTDSALDWISTKPGWTHLNYADCSGFEATVYPFSFPESCGDPVLAALSSATDSIDVSIYLMSSPKVVSVLCQKEREGVEVRVLFEGSPLGVDISTELSLMKSLTDSGGEVRVINYSGSDSHRYTYVHNKYAVIDRGTVIVTSENWTSGNIGEYGNRGWGAIVRSAGYAEYMERIFENDYSLEWGDVKQFSALYPNCKTYSGLPQVPLTEMNLAGYSAIVTPAVSPDNSLSAIGELIMSAGERLYAEQMDLGSSMASSSGDTPISWMSQASERGVDVRFILDSSQSNGSSHEASVNLITGTTGIKAICVDGGDNYDLIHNKGVISDDKVWIGSVNWTETSFGKNRECAVVIECREVADYFSRLFLSDFGINIYTVEEGGIELTAEVFDTPDGQMVMLTVDGPDGYTYEWDLGNGETRTNSYSHTLFKAPSEGDYLATVRMVETGNVSNSPYSVPQTQEQGHDPIYMYSLLIIIFLPILGIIVSFLRNRGKVVRGNRRGRPGQYRPYR